jgi:branched-chain amino acid transport system permease protein
MHPFFGPFAGATAFLLLESAVARWTEHWPLVAGAAFVLCVLFFREGIWGTLVGWLRR